MRMRHLGLLSLAGMAIGFALVPTARAGDAPAPTETVQILDAKAAGDLSVTVRGAGDARVKFTLQNRSAKRLNVVIPPGLVAASAAGQAFQSMGLGPNGGNPGGFGSFPPRARDEAGFRSVPVSAPEPTGVAVSPGQTLEFHVPSVCLNYGITTPTSRHVFELVDVGTYTTDPRVQKALRSLATLGTSQPVAQAVMWHVANGLSFERLTRQTAVTINAFELSQAARFVEALDASSGDLVDPSYFQTGRIVVRVHGEGVLAKDALRLARDLDGASLLGLPVRVVEDFAVLAARPGTIALNVALTGSRPGQTVARVSVRTASAFGEWAPLGQFDARSDHAAGDLKGETFAADLDRAIARNFVSVATARRAPGMTTLRVTNRLPLTLSHVTVRAGNAGDLVTLDAKGIGPARSVLTPIPAASAVVDRVQGNGL